MQTKLKDVAPNDVLRCTGWPTLSLRCSQPIVNSHFMHSPRLCDKTALLTMLFENETVSIPDMRQSLTIRGSSLRTLVIYYDKLAVASNINNHMVACKCLIIFQT